MRATFEDSVLNMDKQDQEFGLKLAKHFRYIFFKNEEDFLYDMIVALRYLNTSPDTVAYTDKDKYIYLNAPNGGHVGKYIDKWKFIYIHECLHQIWDTFGVGDQIEKEQGECDHMLLNIASDCVINDFIYYYYKMDYPTDNLITPEYIYDTYKVEYNNRQDNQYTLYMKLLPFIEKIKMDPSFQKMMDELGSKGTPNTNIPQGRKGQQGQQGQQSNQQGQQGDQRGSHEETSDSWSDDEYGFNKELSDFQEELSRDERLPQRIIDQYKNSARGVLGDFIKKCRIAKTQGAGISSFSPIGRERKRWGAQFMSMAISIMRSGIARIEKEYRRTYARPSRRSGVATSGQMLKKGTIEIKRGATITMKFFIDISGSMGDTSVRNCFKSVWSVCDEIFKMTRNNRIIEKVNYMVHPFNDSIMAPVKYGEVPRSTGGNVDFPTLLEHMSEENENTMISVIITDAQWNIPVSSSAAEIRKMPGNVIVITNSNPGSVEVESFEEIEDRCSNFKLILADKDFTLSI